MRWKAFWIEPTDQERVWLRRYAGDSKCPLPWGYHDHMDFLKDRPVQSGTVNAADDYDRPSDDPLSWPTHCNCGYAFADTDARQVFNLTLWKGALDGKLYTLRDMPPGALWDATWYHEDGHNAEWCIGPDGMSLHCKLPNGHDWCIDQEASNCTRKQWVPAEHGTQWGGRTHYCWIRHGDPRTGNVHVDKNGNTCAAGAGSIQSGKWHGYLHNGWLRDDAG